MSDDLYDGIMEAIDANELAEAARASGVKPPADPSEAPAELSELSLKPGAAIRIAAQAGMRQVWYPAKREYAGLIPGYDKEALRVLLKSKGYAVQSAEENFDLIHIFW